MPVQDAPDASAVGRGRSGVRRAAGAARARARAARARVRAALPPGRLGVALVFAMAGLLFSTSAQTARGTQLRSEQGDLMGLIAAESARVEARAERVAGLRAEVERETGQNVRGNTAVRMLERRSAGVVTAAGLDARTGPGLVVRLDDAPRDLAVPDDALPDDLVVHQQDVQAVVNALWAGGAEAMMLQDQRVISTSAVRCVGNTLILQGRVYSPPYVITAIGDVDRLERALDASPDVAVYLQYVAALRLGWAVERRSAVTVPAYSGALALRHATVPGAGSATAAPPPVSPTVPTSTPDARRDGATP